ncbi:hypothetical protein EAMG_01709 [Escherichia coli M056]|uniref:DUF7338 family protein n=1 Tax=Escherichia coli TaxID=562 RepID=UPI000A1849A7|nr:hypothetical protein [Escherichia coli]OSK23640.1 hypothetical protein EAMG_01709 [Escherichia coli M056]
MKIFIGILLWLLFVPLNLLVVLTAYIFAPVIVLFCRDDGWLPRWLWWFQTPDNPMDGDSGWKCEHWQWRFKLPWALARYIGRVGWCWRNPAYGFAINVLGAKNPPTPFKWYGNPNTGNHTPTVDGWLIVTAGIWWNVYVIAPFCGRTFRLYLGWKLRSGEGRRVYQMVCYLNPFRYRG